MEKEDCIIVVGMIGKVSEWCLTSGGGLLASKVYDTMSRERYCTSIYRQKAYPEEG